MNHLKNTRRDFIRAMGYGALMAGCSSLNKENPEKDSPPNILILHTDEFRFDCLGAYGNKEVKTPNLDQLAADGVLYENSFCPYPVCTPSRYSLLTGIYVHDHKGVSNKSTLSQELSTFPRILRSAGYKTEAVGKMHFFPTYLDVGFDKMRLSEQDGPGRWDDDYHRYLKDQGLVDAIDLMDQRQEYRKRAPKKYWKTFGACVSNLKEKDHPTTWVGDEAIKTIESWNKETPSLLMAAFIKPHHPFDPPAPWHKMYDPKKTDIPPGWTKTCLAHDLEYSKGYFHHTDLTEDVMRRITAYYYALISQLDHQVGRIIDLLKKKNLYHNTLIVFTADHGDYMGFHHMLLKGNYMYDPVIKVPLIIKWPQNFRAGRVSRQLVNNVDIAPTLCLAAGCRPGPRMAGVNLHDQDSDVKYVFAESHGGKQSMIRSHTSKLIVLDCEKKGNKKFFYDLERDPYEIHNRFQEEKDSERLLEMEGLLDSWRAKKRIKPFMDPNAKQIDQPNVPPKDLSHRAEIIKYYSRKMEEFLGD